MISEIYNRGRPPKKYLTPRNVESEKSRRRWVDPQNSSKNKQMREEIPLHTCIHWYWKNPAEEDLLNVCTGGSRKFPPEDDTQHFFQRMISKRSYIGWSPKDCLQDDRQKIVHRITSKKLSSILTSINFLRVRYNSTKLIKSKRRHLKTRLKNDSQKCSKLWSQKF